MKINNEIVMVGPTGIFELDNLIEIKSFTLVENSYLNRVIIDVLYDKGE